MSNTGTPKRQWIDGLDTATRNLDVVWKSRKGILLATIAATALFTVLLYIMPGTYTATTTILPDIEGLQYLQKRGVLGDLAAAAGLTTGLTPSQLYPEILKSERLLREVMAQKFQVVEGGEASRIAEIWGSTSGDTLKDVEKTFKQLRNAMDVTLDKRTLVVTLSVKSESPVLSAQLANAMASALDRFTLGFRKTLAGEHRTWIENRLGEVERDLKGSEEALKIFRERNRNIANSPQLMLSQARLARDVEINSTIFVELKKQLELAKIEEAKTTSIVIILDPARPPYLKSGPARRYLVAAFFGIVALVAVGVVLARRRIGERPDLALRVRAIRKIFVRSPGGT